MDLTNWKFIKRHIFDEEKNQRQKSWQLTRWLIRSYYFWFYWVALKTTWHTSVNLKMIFFWSKFLKEKSKKEKVFPCVLISIILLLRLLYYTTRNIIFVSNNCSHFSIDLSHYLKAVFFIYTSFHDRNNWKYFFLKVNKYRSLFLLQINLFRVLTNKTQEL